MHPRIHARMSPKTGQQGAPDTAGGQPCLKLNLVLTAGGVPGLWIRTVIE